MLYIIILYLIDLSSLMFCFIFKENLRTKVYSKYKDIQLYKYAESEDEKVCMTRKSFSNVVLNSDWFILCHMRVDLLLAMPDRINRRTIPDFEYEENMIGIISFLFCKLFFASKISFE